MRDPDAAAPRPLLIAGPTASGKSALALAWAEAVGGSVINADALQVYADWRILTARPDDADLARAPHQLYGHVDAAERDYSVGRWLRELAPLLADARRARRPVAVVGGSGLYLSALTEGLAPIPPVPPEIRAEAAARGAAALLADLDRGDPDTAGALDRRNPRRVQRAWEVWRATGEGLAAWAARTEPPLLPPADCARVLLTPDRARLHARIAARFERMLRGGALEEVRAVRARALAPDLPAMQALGARPLLEHLEGRRDRADAVDAAIVATRQYAKRQETWFRGRMADWRPLDEAALAAAYHRPAALTG